MVWAGVVGEGFFEQIGAKIGFVCDNEIVRSQLQSEAGF